MERSKACEEKGCMRAALECRILHPNPGALTKAEHIFYWYCPEHAEKHGFCPGCGEHSLSGLCESCEADGNIVKLEDELAGYFDT